MYHEVGSTTDNRERGSASSFLTKTTLINGTNVYDGCESFGANWLHGTNGTISATHVHNGTNAIKIDNSAGNNAYAALNVLPANPNGRNQEVRHSRSGATPRKVATVGNAVSINDGSRRLQSWERQEIAHTSINGSHPTISNGTTARSGPTREPLSRSNQPGTSSQSGPTWVRPAN